VCDFPMRAEMRPKLGLDHFVIVTVSVGSIPTTPAFHMGV